MYSPKNTIVVIDDESLNLKILDNDLTEAGYETKLFLDGEKAWSFVQKNQNIAAILLDRMMPNMDGMAFLKKIKSNEKLKDIPIIMQTAATSQKETTEGIQAGVFYYLTKPFETELMLAIVRSAIDHASNTKQMTTLLDENKRVLHLVNSAKIGFNKPEEAKDIAQFLSACTSKPHSVIAGLMELLMNSIEHGNLSIGFRQKTELLKKGTFITEIENRLNDDRYKNKKSIVTLEKKSQEVSITIEDDGDGFEWEEYMDFDSDRVTSPNGRGIAIANKIIFDKLEYSNGGSKVTATLFD